MNLEEQVKQYYRCTENYDWTRAVDRFIGPETIFHWTRCKETLKLDDLYNGAAGDLIAVITILLSAFRISLIFSKYSLSLVLEAVHGGGDDMTWILS